MKSQIYISCEIVHAEKISELDFVTKVKGEKLDRYNKLLFRGEGFKVTYQDNQVAYIPEELFTQFFRPLSPNENALVTKSIIESNDK